MLTIARRTAGLWWRTWPWLVAIYLVGWIIRYWVLQLAIAIGIDHGSMWGSLVLAVVPMARLLTYLAMFLVIRSATTGLQHVDTAPAVPRGPVDITLTAVMPFLVIYTAWKLVVEDYYVYYSTVSITTVYEGTQDQVSAVVNNIIGPSVWVVIAIAFTLRQLITRFREQLPRWTMVLGVYFEIVWLFLTIQASFAVLFGTPEWIAQRRIVVWWSDTREELFSHLSGLGLWWDLVSGVLGLLLPAAGLALAWIAIASAVYGTPFEPTWQGGRQTFLGHRGDAAAARAIARGRRTVAPRWQRVPSGIQTRVIEFLRGQLGRFASLADASRLILHGGLVPISFFILAYTVLVLAAPSGAYFDPTVTDGWLFRGVALVLGPHEWQWWQAYDDTIRVVIGALVEPIRICLVAATFWYCVDQVRSHHETSARLEPQHDR
ncbi:hypothetical protein [Mycobacterium sp. 236(2023)]|uniref:hypothetical protein n=1 Tax=Mycobacterium sp. 236(2023) TaxID=3038163 RepID=UPI0024154698|nr:hypothetical protein [Mycobacterium sp. 236(2023)]MDG4663378.1 hypothetical protein [Mycobacterium sp. 236(2023)]